MCFVLMKGWSTYAKQNKTLELQFWEKTSSAIRAILIIAFFKNRRLSAEGIFAWKKNFFAIFEKINGFDYFRLRQIPGQSLKEIDFFDPKRTEPFYRETAS